MFQINLKIFKLLTNLIREPLSTDAKQRKNAEYLLISRPTCGRTWVREMLSYIFSEISGIKVDSKSLHAYLYKYSELDRQIPSIKPTHELFLGQEAYLNKKVIFLVRDPRDALVSNGLKIIKTRATEKNQTLDEFISRTEFLDKTIDLYNNWSVNRDIPRDFLLVRYEDLVINTIDELRKVTQFIGLDVSTEILQRAIDRASLDNLKKALQNQDSNSEISNRVRQGKIGGYLEKLDREQIIEVEAKINNKLDPIYGYNYNSF